uniref:10 kDa protein n=1 Tax=Narcissus mosaic virus TaxID=12180 RepID=V5T770_NMV|nr:10 kDa protein [Narcissus mosaic virus]
MNQPQLPSPPQLRFSCSVIFSRSLVLTLTQSHPLCGTSLEPTPMCKRVVQQCYPEPHHQTLRSPGKPSLDSFTSLTSLRASFACTSPRWSGTCY